MAVHPSWQIKNLRRRVNRARKFPDNTCASSRHLHIMADRLAAGKQYFMFTEEPEHCAMSMYAVLEALWKARTEIARLKKEQPNAPHKPRSEAESA